LNHEGTYKDVLEKILKGHYMLYTGELMVFSTGISYFFSDGSCITVKKPYTSPRGFVMENLSLEYK